MDPFLAGLLVKMLVTVGIVVVASVLVEKTGPFIGAMIATLPISAGPSYVFLAMDHDSEFIARSALVTLYVNVGTALFATTYAHLAQRRGMLASLCAGLLAWGGTVSLFVRLDAPLPVAVALNLLVYGAAIMATRKLRTAPPARAPGRRHWEIPARAFGVMSLVAVVMVAGRALGPVAAGIAAAFPIVMSSLVVILHTSVGGRASAATLAHTLPGMAGFGLAITALHLTAEPLGSAAALSIALAMCLGWNGGLVLLSRRRSGRATAPA